MARTDDDTTAQIADIERQYVLGCAAHEAAQRADDAGWAAEWLLSIACEERDSELGSAVEKSAREAAVARDAAQRLRLYASIDYPGFRFPVQWPLVARLRSAALELGTAAEDVSSSLPEDPPANARRLSAQLRSAALELLTASEKADAARPPADEHRGAGAG